MYSILQSNPSSLEQITGTVAQLTESSIQLAEAAANFGALKLMFGIFIVFIFIMMILFIFQIISYNRKLADIFRTTKMVENHMEQSASKTLGKPQASLLIHRLYGDLAIIVKYLVVKVRLEYKINSDKPYNREAVMTRVENLVRFEMSELKSFLSEYHCGEFCMGECVTPEDTQAILDFVVDHVFEPRDVFTISVMDQTAEIVVSGVRMNALTKLH